MEAVRGRATALVRETTGDRSFTDVNYIIPTFILTQLPIGLIGMLIVAILMAATDTIAGELNSLSTATVIDFYKRRFKPEASDAHYLRVSKAATGVWGLFACAVAVWAAELGSLIEVVNRFGSFFYGSILGVFILAVALPARHRQRRVHRTDRRHGVGRVGGEHDEHRVPLAQRHRRGGGRRGRDARQPGGSGKANARVPGQDPDPPAVSEARRSVPAANAWCPVTRHAS